MNRLSGVVLSVFIIFLSVLPAFSQETGIKDLAKEIQGADNAFYFDENYLEAAGLYEILLKSYPGNKNLEAKLGICCLNLDGRQKEALDLLRKASANMAADEKEYMKPGEKAPADTWFYLASAYHVNDSLEKALNYYYLEKKRLAGVDVAKDEFIDLRIRDCRYALEQKKKPLTIISNLFTSWLKDYPGACNPVLAKNDSVFIFTQKTGEKTRILCSYKNGTWLTPIDITRQLGGLERFYSNSITGDGKHLVLFIDDGGDGNLYFSERKDTVWSKMRNPGKPINTIYWESHGFITPDGNTIFLASNRPEGYGELDIWKSDKGPDGKWGEPINCGQVINTPYNENTPFFDPANNALVFSSVGHMSMGGYDVFRSVYRNGAWTNPVGMPFAFNTTGENTFFILNNNAPGFVASLYDEKEQARNIYSIVAIDPADEITWIEGLFKLGDGAPVDPGKASIRLTDISKKTPARQILLNKDASFRFDVKPGDYEMLFSHLGYLPQTVKLNIPLYYLSHHMELNSSLTPEKPSEGSFLSMKNVLFAFDKYTIDDEAKSVIDAVMTILTSHPALRIEVAGYADSKGPEAYNMKLAGERAQAVINYLVSEEIPASSFIKKSFGESGFAAINSNPDGSDNPEGRKFNRRAAFGIIDPNTGVVIRQESFTPSRLRLQSSGKYYLVLKKTGETLRPDYFRDINPDGFQLVRSIKADPDTYIYVVGLLCSKADADKYLLFARSKGFNEAYIADQYEINDIENNPLQKK